VKAYIWRPGQLSAFSDFKLIVFLCKSAFSSKRSVDPSEEFSFSGRKPTQLYDLGLVVIL
jgi:hypothetical protein